MELWLFKPTRVDAAVASHRPSGPATEISASISHSAGPSRPDGSSSGETVSRCTSKPAVRPIRVGSMRICAYWWMSNSSTTGLPAWRVNRTLSRLPRPARSPFIHTPPAHVCVTAGSGIGRERVDEDTQLSYDVLVRVRVSQVQDVDGRSKDDAAVVPTS